MENKWKSLQLTSPFAYSISFSIILLSSVLKLVLLLKKKLSWTSMSLQLLPCFCFPSPQAVYTWYSQAFTSHSSFNLSLDSFLSNQPDEIALPGSSLPSILLVWFPPNGSFIMIKLSWPHFLFWNILFFWFLWQHPLLVFLLLFSPLYLRIHCRLLFLELISKCQHSILDPFLFLHS